MKKIFVLFSLLFCFFFKTNAQSANAEKCARLTPEEFKNYYLKNHSRQTSPRYTQTGTGDQVSSLKRSSGKLPGKVSVAGEFEEMQAIFVNWPYISYDTAGNLVELTFEDYFLAYDAFKQKEVLVKVAESIPDTFVSSPMPVIYSQLIHHIQKEATAYINIYNASDSFIVKRYMSAHGYQMSNYKFLIHKGNSIWYRDCGPIPFYYGNSDSIGLLNFEYYGGRPLDDDLPLKWGNDLGYPVYTNSIEYEAGNMMIDGAGTLFTSSAVSVTNGDNNGQVYLDKTKPDGFAYKTKTALNKNQLADSFKRIMNLSNVVILPSLKYDGGTGHLDLYADMSDNGTIITSDHPAVLNKTGFPDYAIVAKNTLTMQNTGTIHTLNFQNYKIPFPTKDDGTWYNNGIDYENYTRTYSNHLVVNKSIIQPIFSDGSSGNAAGDAAAILAIKKQFPGYKIWPIDMRAFDGYGGLIHCITMHLPAENPIRILHYPIRYFQVAASGFKVEAYITNKSGIQSANCKWRKKGTQNWTNIALSENGSTYTGTIPGDINAFYDTIEYYIEARSNNGKTISRPMTAPEGFYTFYYGMGVVGITNTKITADNFNLYPNPSQHKFYIDCNSDAVQNIGIKIYDVTGREMKSIPPLKLTKNDTLIIDIADYPQGIYFVEISANGSTVSKKLVVE